MRVTKINGLHVLIAGLVLLPSMSGLRAQVLDPTKPPGANFNLTNYYLGLPVDSSGWTNGLSASVPAAQLITGYSNAWYFYTGPDGAMTFWAFVLGATTSGSSYPRSELREQLSPPSNTSNWLAYGTHTLDAQCKVTQVPSSGKVIIGQIHGYTGAALPLVKLQYNNGTIEALIKTNANDTLTDKKYIYSYVGLSNTMTYQIKAVDGLISVTVNGTTQSLNVFQTDPDWATNTLYFKAGSYCQDNVGTTNEGSRVAFYSLARSHAPSIANQPANCAAVVGGDPTFSVGATGNGRLFYQWRFNETNNLANATNAFLTLTNVQTTNAGDYSVTVTDSLGSVTSAVAMVTVNVNAGPSITTPPANQAVVAGQNATFNVIASGTEPLSYQWWFNATNNLIWATNASLTITNAQRTNAGSYAVVVTNSYGSVTSAAATLTVNAGSSSMLARARYQGVITNQSPMYYNSLDNSLAPAIGTGIFNASSLGTAFANDYFGNAYGAASFSDSTAQLSCLNGGNIVNGVGAANSIGSLCLLFRTPNTTLSGTQYIFSNGDVQTSGTGYQLALSLGSGVLQLKAGNRTLALPTLTNGVWYYFATTWDFSGANSPAYGIHYYLGVAGEPSEALWSGFTQRGGTGNISSTAILGTNGAFVVSGKQPPANSGSGFQISGIPGSVDELATWNSQLSASQIADQFSALAPFSGPPPALGISAFGSNVIVSWAASADPGFVLESTINLASPGWASAGTAVVIGDQNVVTNALLPGAQFYRLKK
jgi:hypothetical protein